MIEWTRHAMTRARERSGLTVQQLTKRISQMLNQGRYYEPGQWARDEDGELWVNVDGPKGKATAVLVPHDEDPGCYSVITIRKANVFRQGEDQDKQLQDRPFKRLLGGT